MAAGGVNGYLREIALRVVAAAEALGAVRAALLVGSVAREDADSFSDLDLLLYVEELPPPGRLGQLCDALGGTELVRLAPRSDDADAAQFLIGRVPVQIAYQRVAASELELDSLLDSHEVIDAPRQKMLAGLLEGHALRGDDLLSALRQRASRYPDHQRRAAIEQHWRFFPLWFYQDALTRRDAELWRLNILLDGAFDVLAVLAALNRVYYSRFEMKRLHALTGKMTIAPANLANRIESLFTLGPREAADELGRLVTETRTLVLREIPDAQVPLRRGTNERIQPWQPA